MLWMLFVVYFVYICCASSHMARCERLAERSLLLHVQCLPSSNEPLKRALGTRESHEKGDRRSHAMYIVSCISSYLDNNSSETGEE